MEQEIINKIIQKKEFSQLPKKDVEVAFSQFEKRQTIDEEKIKLTRQLLHKVFGAFTSEKLFNEKILDKKTAEEILKKHSSTRERLEYYPEIYSRIFSGMNKKISVIDLGAGVNGFSYNYFKKLSLDVNYIGVEAIGQLVELVNNYFSREKIKGKAIHMSLFELEEIKRIVESSERPRVIFLFKVLDSLEMLEKNYSKKLISELIGKCDKFVVSFATQSMISRRKFKVKRYWFENFVRENFKVVDDFEIGGERYLVFKK